jgi:Protein of unknown function (DUF2848)
MPKPPRSALWGAPLRGDRRTASWPPRRPAAAKRLAQMTADSSLRFTVEPDGTGVSLAPEVLIVAGYTGRDQSAVFEHIRELAEQGIEPPEDVPCFYPLSPNLLTQSGSLVTAVEETSGEAEVALLVDGSEIYVTVASDHTDRAAERIDVALSKGACHKVLARTAWRLSDVVDHWDSLRLRSWIGSGTSDPYQDGSTEALLAPDDLLDAIPWSLKPRSYAVLCGTLPAIGGLRGGEEFRAELADAQTGATLELNYRIDVRSYLAQHGAAGQSTQPSGAERVRASARSYEVEVSDDRIAQLGARLESLEQRLLG